MLYKLLRCRGVRWLSVLLFTISICIKTNAQEPAMPYGEVVLYPMLSLDNHTLDCIYHYSLSLAPALEIHPWRGGKLTGQVIVPLMSNDRGSQQRRLRAGVNTVQQTVRWQRLLVRAAVGLFTNHRSGIDVRAAWLMAGPECPLTGGGACLLTGEAGYTGLFICDSRIRYFERWNQWSGACGIDYYNRAIYTRFEVRTIFDLNGRQGWRADVTRRFRRAAIGFYGNTIGGDRNVGFHFAVKLRNSGRQSGRLSLRAPEYWDWQYTMKSKSYHQGYGNYYETSPDWNHAVVFGSELCPAAYGTE